MANAGVVSERKPVGSTRTDKDSIVDLIGDDSAPSSASTRAPSGPSTQDLLADIFGGGDMSSDPAAASSSGGSAPARNANAGILSLFDSSPAAAAPAPSASGSNSLFDLGSGSSAPSSSAAPPAAALAPAAVAAAAPSRSQLQSYTAYEKNGLKITLTPKAAPGQAGVVQVLARFTAQEAVENVNFQVAVPKVSLRALLMYNG